MEGYLVNGHAHGGHGLLGRIYARHSVERAPMPDFPSLVSAHDVPTRVVIRDDSTSTPDSTGISPHCTGANANSSYCEKPLGSSSLTIPIAIGVGIPLVGGIILLLYLHRRNMKKMKLEDATDPNRNLDFGMDRPGKGRRKSSFFGGGEKGGKERQMSMDLDMSTPYLLPPALHESRESLHSLARTLHQNEDPYRPVAQYAASEANSIRSFKPGHEGSSIYTSSTSNRNRSAPSRQNTLPDQGPSRQNSFPKPETPITDPFQTPSPSARNSFPSPEEPQHNFHTMPEPAIIHGRDAAPYPDDGFATAVSAMPHVPEIQEPEPVAQKGVTKGQNGVHSSPNEPAVAPHSDNTDYHHGPIAEAGEPRRPEQAAYGLGLQDVHIESSSLSLTPPQAKSLPASAHTQDGYLLGDARVAQTADLHAGGHSADHREHDDYYDEADYHNQAHPHGYDQEDQHQKDHQLGYQRNEYNHDYHQDGYHHDAQHSQDHYEQHNYQHQHDQYGYDDQDYNRHHATEDQETRRRSVDLQKQDQSHLGAPQFDDRRLSVGFRPLPPDEYLGESEDPEYRANRIRSFYKEYFDEHRNGNHPPLPRQQGTQYHEDYDAGYAADGAFYDPASNAFVMPYAQPVTRRAMTPPPTASRFRRGPPPPRGPHGSVGGMSLPGGRGPRRPGSSNSNQAPWNLRPGSAGSSARGRPKKPLPPPSTLTTLPNPSKLRDDTFALMCAIDFAPPDTFKDHAAGRSQSPAGERRPYQLNVPVHSPLVSSYDEMPAVPSPHLLRKSGTFTGLDFAPPRRFKESDTMSDAGSIRSNRSGISVVQQQALRSGAGRVSRLPGDTIFTQAAMSDKLKPQWGMRD